MRFIAYLLLPVILLAISPVRAQECPECAPIDAWFAENGGACGYHGNRLPSICDLDPECVEWNRACNAKRDEQSACIARCLAGDPPPPPPQSRAPELDEFDRDMAALERSGYDPFAEQQSPEWCEARRRELAARAAFLDRSNLDRERRQAQFEEGIIGFVIAQTGSTDVHRCSGGSQPMQRGTPLHIGDCVETDNDGRLRIQMMDRDDQRNTGPSVINVGTNSRLCANSFFFHYDDVGQLEEKSLIDLLHGAVKVFFRGWRNNSSFSVQAGIAVCGIRGSEVIVRREPSDGSIQVGVIKGHAWLGNRETREIRYLEAGQWAQDRTDGMTEVQAMSRADWDRMLVQDGLDLVSEAIDLSGPDCGLIVGRWRWFTGSIVDFTADNRWQTPDGENLGSWHCTVTVRGDDAVVVIPDAGGWEDVVVIDPGGVALRGQSRTGADVSAVRIYP